MAKACVSVHIDLEDIDTWNLVEEIKERKNEVLNELFPLLDDFQRIDLEKLNILDESKLRYFLTNFDKITEEQLKNIVEK